MFQLCRQFDCRFIVIADRFECAKPMEEIKDRFYSCCNKLLQGRRRQGSALESGFQTELANFVFDKERETDRRKHLRALLQRTPAQLQEEEMLMQEVRRIETSAKKLMRDRQQLLLLLNAVDAVLGRPATGTRLPGEKFASTVRQLAADEVAAGVIKATPKKASANHKSVVKMMRSGELDSPDTENDDSCMSVLFAK